MATIQIRTEIPGPRSRALMARREAAIPRGPANATPIFAARADGAVIEDVDGNRYLDFAGGIGCLNIGHRSPRVISAIREQLEKYLHLCFAVTPYGLAAAVWTRDIYKAFRVVKSLRAGIVWVNHMQPTYVEAPWGGYKQSGFGRELGPWGLEEYLETKQVFVNLDETPIGWY